MTSEAPFLYLLTRSSWNRVRRLAVRVRSPRYAIALVIGIAYVIFAFTTMLRNGTSSQRPPFLDGVILSTFAPLLVIPFLARWWIWGNRDNSIIFSPAEVNFLFPAPFPRRRLIQYNLGRAQIGLLWSISLFTLITQSSDLAWPLRFVSCWMLFTTMYLHQVASSLVNANARTVRGVRRSGLPVLIFSTWLALLVMTLWRAIAPMQHAADFQQALAGVVQALGSPEARLVLLPLRVAFGTILAPGAAAWLAALAPALALMMLHYLWVIRSDAAFEETAAEASARRAQRVENVHRGLAGAAPITFASKPWFALRPTGMPEAAITWKNFLAFTRHLRAGSLLTTVAITGATFAIISLSSANVASWARLAASGLTTYMVLVTLMGPAFFRNDLRADLRHAELLLTYPLNGRQLVRAEIAGALASLTVAQLTLGALTFVILLFTPLPAQHPGYIVAGAVLLLMGAPPINAIGIAIQNALALLYPAWVRIGTNTAQGMEAMGQTMLTMVASVILLAFALVGPAAAAAFISAIISTFDGRVHATILAAIVAWLLLWGELWLIVGWLGDIYDAFDPSEAGLLP